LFGPLIVPLGQHGADQAGDGLTVGEDFDDVGAADLAVEPLEGLIEIWTLVGEPRGKYLALT